MQAVMTATSGTAMVVRLPLLLLLPLQVTGNAQSLVIVIDSTAYSMLYFAFAIIHSSSLITRTGSTMYSVSPRLTAQCAACHALGSTIYSHTHPEQNVPDASF